MKSTSAEPVALVPSPVSGTSPTIWASHCTTVRPLPKFASDAIYRISHAQDRQLMSDVDELFRCLRGEEAGEAKSPEVMRNPGRQDGIPRGWRHDAKPYRGGPTLDHPGMKPDIVAEIVEIWM